MLIPREFDKYESVEVLDSLLTDLVSLLTFVAKSGHPEQKLQELGNRLREYLAQQSQPIVLTVVELSVFRAIVPVLLSRLEEIGRGLMEMVQEYTELEKQWRTQAKQAVDDLERDLNLGLLVPTGGDSNEQPDRTED